MRRFKTGKIPSDMLSSQVFPYRGAHDPSVMLGSSIGEDAALISLNKKVLVLKTDPLTGAESDIGWLAVHINANDVACRGARPRWFLCDVLLPERSRSTSVRRIMREVDRAAKQIGVAVVGGHTEVTPGLSRPIVVGYMVGLVERAKVVTSNGGRPGDHVIMTKAAGIEGTAILASDFSKKITRLGGGRILASARRLRRSISVIEDALVAARCGGVHAMHDPTEGGILQGLWELAVASKVGVRVNETSIPIKYETKRICSILQVNPLRLLSSGSLLIAADRRRSARILRALRQRRIEATVIGTLLPRSEGRKLIRQDGRKVQIGPSERDELYRVIERYRSI